MSLSRQELYDRIKASSKEAYILSEMKRLGFWQTEKPTVAHEILDKRAALETEIASISRQISDPEAALEAIHQERMAAARERRVEAGRPPGVGVGPGAGEHRAAIRWSAKMPPIRTSMLGLPSCSIARV